MISYVNVEENDESVPWSLRLVFLPQWDSLMLFSSLQDTRLFSCTRVTGHLLGGVCAHYKNPSVHVRRESRGGEEVVCGMRTAKSPAATQTAEGESDRKAAGEQTSAAVEIITRFTGNISPRRSGFAQLWYWRISGRKEKFRSHEPTRGSGEAGSWLTEASPTVCLIMAGNWIKQRAHKHTGVFTASSPLRDSATVSLELTADSQLNLASANVSQVSSPIWPVSTG